MKARQIQARVAKRLPSIAQEAYGPIRDELLRLIELSKLGIPDAVFYAEVKQAFERIPQLYPLLRSNVIQDELETAMGEAIIGGLKV